jgi:hypothetical protein
VFCLQYLCTVSIPTKRATVLIYSVRVLQCQIWVVYSWSNGSKPTKSGYCSFLTLEQCQRSPFRYSWVFEHPRWKEFVREPIRVREGSKQDSGPSKLSCGVALDLVCKVLRPPFKCTTTRSWYFPSVECSRSIWPVMHLWQKWNILPLHLSNID